MKKILFSFTVLTLSSWLVAQDPTPACTKDTKQYNDNGFANSDFVDGGQGLLFGDTIAPEVGGEINTEDIVFPTDQPFVVDYLSEGAGANHLFGFFFMDIDTNGNGFPDFFETGDLDDLDGDGIVNEDDDDIDGDGIDNNSDVAPAWVTNSTDPLLFRNAIVAYNGGHHANDYWEFVPNNVVSGRFEHPGAYLYVDNDNNDVPDVLQYRTGANRVPPMALNRGYNTRLATTNAVFPGLLGTWFYSGTGAAGDFHWVGSTIFKLADDDGGTGVDGSYGYTPYNTITDIYGSANAWPDYDIYGTTNEASSLIPDELKANDARGERLWRYRWFEGTVSGGREYCFFLVVFYGSGGSNVNTYYSKSGFNQDQPPGTPNRNGATTGDQYGGVVGSANWYPNYRSTGDHNTLAQAVFGMNWNQIVDTTQGYPPVAFDPDNQAWVDKWENWTANTRIVQYRGLADWFSETPVDANTIISGRYNIDMSGEGESGIVRAINGNMAHLMVGAPSSDPEAWLLGWEDLYGGGDRDYEDVVFYVKREAAGVAQSLNVAGDLDQFEDVSITSVEFTFVDNFTDDLWGTEGTYISYSYRLASNDEWIVLLGDDADVPQHHLRLVDVFTTTTDNGLVTRHASIQLDQEGARELYWKVEMKTSDSDAFVPEVNEADVGYEALVHELYFNSATITSSNLYYDASLETPSFGWMDRSKNRGHLYSFIAFDHGPTPTLHSLDATFNYLTNASNQPGPQFAWDAGVSVRDQANRTIYTYVDSGGGLQRRDFDSGMTADVINALQLSPAVVDGVMIDNFHNPASPVLEPVLASNWLAEWVHGYIGAISDGATTIPGADREWKLGGVNRSTLALIRAPGTPIWLSGSGIPVLIKQSYSQWIGDPQQQNTPTRLLVGSEAGMVHVIDGGRWVGRRCDPLDQPADGCYLDYGTGEEVYAMIPGNLLEDIKYNYTGRQSVSAKIDATPIVGVIRAGGNWRRVAVMAQGENGGTLNGRVGNAIWAMDVTDPDDPIPLWEYTHDAMNNIIHPLAMSWAELSGGPQWIVGANSGASPLPTERPTLYFLDAYSGNELLVRQVGSVGESIAGAPALIDADQNGYVDWAYASTSEGVLVAQSLESFGTTQFETVANARFYLTPNVAPIGDGKVLVIAVTGDSPLIDDEDGNVNRLVAYIHDTDPSAPSAFTYLGDFELPAGHKAFARPRLVGTQLVMGTTTGETFSFCDPDPNDPGNLYLFDDVFALDAIDQSDPYNTGVSAFVGFGPTRAAIPVSGGRIMAHSARRWDGQNDRSEFSPKGKAPESNQREIAIGNVFGVVGWSEPFLDGNF